MSRNLILLIAIGLGLLTYTSCNTESTTIPYYTLSDEFKSYCRFEIGSMWEYKSSLSEVTGNVGVSNIVENKWTNNYQDPFHYEAVDMFMNTNPIGISMIELTAGSPANSSTSMNSLMWVFYTDGDYRLVFAPQYPIGEEQLLGEHEGIYENVEILPTLQIGENTYTDVYHTKVTDYLENGMGDFDFYIAKYHGLVKMQNIVGNDTIMLELMSSILIQ